MDLVNLTINGKPVSVPKKTTILDAAKKLNINIPNLCHLHMQDINMKNQCASCRVCIVDTPRGFVPSCATNVSEGMVVNTNTPRVLEARKTIVELLLSDHPQDCLICDKSGNCELQKIAQDLGIRGVQFKGAKNELPIDNSSKSIIRDPNKCILCRRCETMCNEIQKVGVLSAVNRGFDTSISTFFNTDLSETNCTYCGQCIAVCPTGALSEVNNIPKVWSAISDENKTCVVQVAPAVRVALGEEFGLEDGTVSTGKMVAALRLLGFKYVFDTNFAADLTILEEASEFLHRLEKGANLPILTSCCPAWINYIEHQYPDLLHLPSTCKSPQEMFGAVAKNYFAPKIGLTPQDLTVVSVMPCVAKKYECSRDELGQGDVLDVDISITTRELAKMIKEAGIDFDNLEPDCFDNPLGESTGAADIFGATGGVLESALRTAYEWVTQEELENVDFKALRGFEGIKEASIDVGGTLVNVCAASSLGSAKKLMDEVREGKSKYHIIEIMACPGGCVAGGGQPYHGGDYDKIKARAKALYDIDANKPLRKSHKNPSILTLYKELLGEPYSENAHKYLHTTYFDKSNVFCENK
ncbi:NADH-dependent [FeFe] hydrogenase, group A6 [Asaccharospora irregularis]|uniref:NAD(P)-dependent iron-only hydrogenase catalytic subunit n=1 Tax=Asaccharospora irregularis DSM 2635 TaxID=1121321 RepID=A0A1M5QVB8_9FIRM|nr:NADH-dependent [FeFe] hydrogenase, group A6 [Asaccharospora irregularis]SHH17649.1 NAD(P)-dependent iron-only hydrogenase catalytic subunit [Asaccharospora irregularis DSM 2635]